MARTPGSGWGAGPLLYQICPKCGKKKCYYYYSLNSFKCTSCKEWSDSNTLIRSKYPQANT